MALFPFNRLLFPAAAVSALVVAAGPVMGQSAASNDRAYTLTLMCTAVASEFGTDADKQRSLDAARKMARAQNYSDRRLSDDLGTMANVVGDKARDHPDEVQHDREICRRMGLVS